MSRSRVLGILSIILMLSVACSLPGIGASRRSQGVQSAPATPTVPPPPTATPRADLPPALVETEPPLGSEISPQQGITFYFNQPMQRASVEAALQVGEGVSGRFEWQDDATVTFYPQTPFTPDSDLLLTIDSSAQAANGKGMARPVPVRFRVAGPLRLTQQLPAPDSGEVNPASAVVAAFNRPVVPLGGDPGEQPAAFSLDPPAQGRGEWLNTSTYIFYPEPALYGGTTYRVSLNPALQSAAGTPLEEVAAWTFTTASPAVTGVTPGPGTLLALDAAITVKFNQPMNPSSVEAALRLEGDGAPALRTAWDETFTTLTVQPQSLLRRGARYTLRIGGEAQSAGGAPLGGEYRADWTTYPRLQVMGLDEAVVRPGYVVQVRLTAPLPPNNTVDLTRFLRLEPSVEIYDVTWHNWDGKLYLNIRGDFQPQTDYVLTISPDLPDAWGDTLGAPVALSFSVSALEPQVRLGSPMAWNDVFVAALSDGGLPVQAANVENISVQSGGVPLEDFIRLVTSDDYDALQQYRPADLRSAEVQVDAPPNRVVPRTLPLPGQTPGVYYVYIRQPAVGEMSSGGVHASPAPLPSPAPGGRPMLVILTNVNLTFKFGQRDALVWATYLDGGQPVPGAPLRLYDASWALIAQGQTDKEGLFYAQGWQAEDTYDTVLAVMGNPGDAYFSAALSTMDAGLLPWNGDIPTSYSAADPFVYIYSDRPIYRPGQTVHFRLVVRRRFDGRYDLPAADSVSILVRDDQYEEVERLSLPLTDFGTASGEYTLPENAPPGYYTLEVENTYARLSFQVAEYRKPEFELQVQTQGEDLQGGDTLTAQVDARYYFGAPVGNLNVQWSLSLLPDWFALPGYAVGPLDVDWFDWLPRGMFGPQGEVVASGEAVTDAEGRFRVEVPLPQEEAVKRYVLEVTAADESGFPVSARAEGRLHPEAYYIGVRAEQWAAPAGSERTFEVRTVNWEGKPSGGRPLSIQFSRVTWEQHPSPDEYGLSTYEKVLTLLAETQLTTDEQGGGRIAFTPDKSGTYQITLRSGGALTEMLFWVGGGSSGVWPALPNQRLLLTADKETYRPGETAQVFVPNPFGVETPALLTLERGGIHRYEVRTIPAGGGTLDVPLGEDEAPNIYLTLTLPGQRADGHPDFRYGALNLPVEPEHLLLNVEVLDLPAEAAPQTEITLRLHVTDADGNPVQGAFSLAAVDKAALALADPNSRPIEEAFYGNQPLSIRTGIGLAAYTLRGVEEPGGMGGGGGAAMLPPVRREFPDTAFWEGEILTDANGEALVTFTLPDSLTTWVLDARGVTRDSRVGQAQAEVTVSKPLLVRPVTPRFVTLGDHFPLAAVVHNNTDETLQVTVQLQAPAFSLDDPSQAVQSLSLEAGGRARVDWWGTVQAAEALEAVFSAEGGRWSDASAPVWGDLSIVRYAAPQTYATSGVLSQADDVLEVVSLPRTFVPESGDLTVEAAPSLAAGMLGTLDALEHYPYECVEQTLSRFLPNLAAYRAVQEFGLQSPELEARLERTLDDGLSRLFQAQREDGGWGWWPESGESNPYITAYVLFGLTEAQEAGAEVPADVLQRAADYLSAALTMPAPSMDDWALDRMAMVLFALRSYGQEAPAVRDALYDLRTRLSPASQALLALTYPQGSAQSDILLSDLQGAAIRSATGAHWEADSRFRLNLGSDVQSTAAVVYALAQRQPASTLLPDAVRYLMSARRGDAWANTYETAWSILALTGVMRGTGELAGDFDFSATLNGAPLLTGNAAGDAQLTPVRAVTPLSDLYPDVPNALVIHRGEGTGRLYYRVLLNALLPVAGLPPLSQGFSVERRYYPRGETAPEKALTSAPAGEMVEVRLTVVVPQEAHYVAVEDYIPAGAEILDTSLKTSQQQGELPLVDGLHPAVDGLWWWVFSPPQIYDDHITWTAEDLPPGTYELTYVLALTQPGEYRVLPARAYEFYFPEVQGRSAGEVFTIGER